MRYITDVISLENHTKTDFYLKCGSRGTGFYGWVFWFLCFWSWLCNLIRFENTNDCISSSGESTDSPLCNLSIEIYKVSQLDTSNEPLIRSKELVTMYVILLTIFGKLTNIIGLALCSFCHWTKWRNKKMSSEIWISSSSTKKITWGFCECTERDPDLLEFRGGQDPLRTAKNIYY